METLAAKGLVQKVLEDSEILRDLGIALEPEEVKRIELANKMRMDLVKKYLPDLKAQELTGADGASLFSSIERLIVDRSKD